MRAERRQSLYHLISHHPFHLYHLSRRPLLARLLLRQSLLLLPSLLLLLPLLPLLLPRALIQLATRRGSSAPSLLHMSLKSASPLRFNELQNEQGITRY